MPLQRITSAFGGLRYLPEETERIARLIEDDFETIVEGVGVDAVPPY